jgi:hypothetical protein
MAETLRNTNPTEVARRNNRRVIKQARKFVWAATDSQLGFIRKHFGELADREVLTDQQRQEAIDAARGRRKDAA